MMKNVKLDDFDRALLARLGTNNQTPARLLAEQVGLSESAVLRRVRNLRKNGVIIADVSVVHPAALDAFERKLRAREELQGAWYVTGEVDFVLLLRVGSMEAYERFTREMFHDDPNVASFRTIVTLREVEGLRQP